LPPLPADVITLPAHLACNKSTSRDEEWVTIGWATCRPFPDDGDARYDKSKRALLRDHAEGLRKKYLTSLKPQPSGGAILDLGVGRVEYVLAKIVKGLLMRQEGILLSQDHTWSIKKVDLAVMVEQEQLTHMLEIHDVAVFRWEVRRSTAFWTLALYNMHIFSGVAVDPVDFDGLSVRVPWLADGVRLPWPKPSDVAGHNDSTGSHR
jgi:hypothetical protein